MMHVSDDDDDDDNRHVAMGGRFACEDIYLRCKFYNRHIFESTLLFIS